VCSFPVSIATVRNSFTAGGERAKASRQTFNNLASLFGLFVCWAGQQQQQQYLKQLFVRALWRAGLLSQQTDGWLPVNIPTTVCMSSFVRLACCGARWARSSAHHIATVSLVFHIRYISFTHIPFTENEIETLPTSI
jgi:hypothetical protein